MRIARGIQNKVLEAMAMGKPVVLTSGALEGIEAQPGTEVLLADDAGRVRCGLLPIGNHRRRCGNRRRRAYPYRPRL